MLAVPSPDVWTRQPQYAARINSALIQREPLFLYTPFRRNPTQNTLPSAARKDSIGYIYDKTALNNQSANVPSHAGAYTVIAVADAASLDSSGTSVLCCANAGAYNWYLARNSTGWISVHQVSSGSFAICELSVTANTVVGTWDGQNTRLFSGSGQASVAAASVIAATNNVIVGCQTEWWNGNLQNGRYWDGPVMLLLVLPYAVPPALAASLAVKPWQIFEFDDDATLLSAASDTLIAGTQSGAGAQAGDVSTSIQPGGAQSGAGAQSGELFTAITPAGVQIGLGTQSGGISNSIILAGAQVGVGAVDGDILTRIDVAGEQIATALQVLSLQSGISVAGIVSGAGAQSGELAGGAAQIQGGQAGEGTQVGNIVLVATIAGQQIADSLIDGGIATVISVAGQQFGAGAQSGGLSGSPALIAGTQSGQGAQSLVLSTSIPVTGQQIADAILLGSLSTEIRIGAVQNGVGMIFGAIHNAIEVHGTVGGVGAQIGNIVVGMVIIWDNAVRRVTVPAHARSVTVPTHARSVTVPA